MKLRIVAGIAQGALAFGTGTSVARDEAWQAAAASSAHSSGVGVNWRPLVGHAGECHCLVTVPRPTQSPRGLSMISRKRYTDV